MDTNNKMRKGIIKGKLAMSFYRAPNKPSTNTTKVVKSSDPQPTLATTGHKAPPPSSFVVNQEKVNPQPKHKVSYAIPHTMGTYDMFDNPYGVVVDEGVDAKATTYISCVQERFKLEHVAAELAEPVSYS